MGFEIKLKKSRLATVLTLTRHTLVPEKLPRDHGDLQTRRVNTCSEWTSGLFISAFYSDWGFFF
jgi:hypothetical protein